MNIIDYSKDGSHPDSGTLVLIDKGKAWYGGYAYYRDGYAPQSAVKPEPTPEPEYVYRAGDRVRVTDGNVYSSGVPAGAIGTVVEDAKADEYFEVSIDGDDEHEGWMFAAEEVEPYTEPTHRHPEGLYQSGPTRVVIRHEPKNETYSILYIDGALEGHPDPVNRGMTKIEQLGYTLVTAFDVAKEAHAYRAVSFDRRGSAGRQVGLQRTSDGAIAGFLRSDTPEAREEMHAKVLADPERWSYNTAYDGIYTDIQPL